ncbi:hypothetical protein CBL_00306 [Carabus blaptoides fortunei]
MPNEFSRNKDHELNIGILNAIQGPRSFKTSPSCTASLAAGMDIPIIPPLHDYWLWHWELVRVHGVRDKNRVCVAANVRTNGCIERYRRQRPNGNGQLTD